MSMDTHKLLYVADPMCSWCWGFSPVINTIAQYYDDQLSILPVMGGLRPLNRTPMDEAMKSEIADHWAHVEERSGQPFDMSFFDRNEFVYDTEPACRAVCVVRRLAPELTLPYLENIQHAFYAQNQDTTDGAVLADLADEVGLDHHRFLAMFNDVMSAYETAGDFQSARQLGITGYPSIVLNKGEEYSLLNAGYQPFEALQEAIDDWLA